MNWHNPWQKRIRIFRVPFLHHNINLFVAKNAQNDKKETVKGYSMMFGLLVLFFLADLGVAFQPTSFDVRNQQHPPERRIAPFTNVKSAILQTPDEMASVSSVEAWESLVPRLWEPSRGVDVTLQWSTQNDDNDETPMLPVEDFVSAVEAQFGTIPPHHRSIITRDLRIAMKDFVHGCLLDADHSTGSGLFFTRPTTTGGFRARLVFGRGSQVTCKCPRWHQDDVVIRHVQSFVGPGCEIFVPPAAPWDPTTSTTTMEHAIDEEESTGSPLHDAVESVLRMEPDRKYTVPTGVAAWLIGKQGVVTGSSNRNENRMDARKTSRTSDDMDACIHKSPQNIKPWQGRVLFTMDVITESV